MARKPSAPRDTEPEPRHSAPLRIIGGEWRGRSILYSGDARTRPMKDRLREAIFNLLGYSVKGATAIDLFAGSGALGLEALSRGAAKAVFIEQHMPTAELIRRTVLDLDIEQLQVMERVQIVPGNTFIWGRRLPGLGSAPWIVFCSPPYDFFVEREADMLALLERLLAAAPPGSQFVVEVDERFPMDHLPQPETWQVRKYFPAFIALRELPVVEK